LQNNLFELSENISLETRERIGFQHDGVSSQRAPILRIDILCEIIYTKDILNAGYNDYITWHSKFSWFGTW